MILQTWNNFHASEQALLDEPVSFSVLYSQFVKQNKQNINNQTIKRINEIILP
ncbi:hypothetical protein [Leptospira limi]|uniref:Uncharacterized protein n=1 Tax=Leptospira limi TaxID=2950023 RepID=A0ABT3LXA5_9LEPT|nr:hypothetical protein [Leptospira limi]MCW7462361.1 hypothetical protein [Leptospira limi]